MMPDYYFHYTSRQAAQSITSVGKIEAGVSGFIYLSLDVYDEGAEVTNALAIEGKPVEVVGMVPGTLLMPSPAVSSVLPIYDPVNGALRRRGGGSQVKIHGPIPASRVRWLTLSIP